MLLFQKLQHINLSILSESAQLINAGGGGNQKIHLFLCSSAEGTAAQFYFVPGSGIVILSHE